MSGSTRDIPTPTPERLDELAGQLSSEFGVQVHVVASDLGSAEGVSTITGFLNGAGLQIDILVNNAGFGAAGEFHLSTSERQLGMIQLNIASLVSLTHSLLLGMRERGEGHIVLVGSVNAFMAVPHFAVYSATKFGVVGLTESLRHEYHGSGVRFTTILPGYVDTELIAGLHQPWWPRPVSPDAVAQAVCKAIRTGRGRVYVPRIGGFLALLPWILPHWLARLLGTTAGVATLLKRVDADRRKNYRTRALVLPKSDTSDQ